MTTRIAALALEDGIYHHCPQCGKGLRGDRCLDCIDRKTQEQEAQKRAACENCKELKATLDTERSQRESETNAYVYLIIVFGGGCLILASFFY
jgi:alpha-D-ribose 1-methylphosphonate 5-triphosphate synthase subunit PhnG